MADKSYMFRLNGTIVDETFEPVSLPDDLKGADSIFSNVTNYVQYFNTIDISSAVCHVTLNTMNVDVSG